MVKKLKKKKVVKGYKGFEGNVVYRGISGYTGNTGYCNGVPYFKFNSSGNFDITGSGKKITFGNCKKTFSITINWIVLLTVLTLLGISLGLLISNFK